MPVKQYASPLAVPVENPLTCSALSPALKQKRESEWDNEEWKLRTPPSFAFQLTNSFRKKRRQWLWDEWKSIDSAPKARTARPFLTDRDTEEGENKWRGVTISLQMGGQGHPIPNHTPTPTPHTCIHEKYPKRSFFHFSAQSPLRTNGWTDGRTDGRTDKASCPQLKTSFL